MLEGIAIKTIFRGKKTQEKKSNKKAGELWKIFKHSRRER